MPFLDLEPMHRPLKDALLRDLSALLDTGAFTNGPAVAEFEQAFASYCGVAHCVGVSSGLDALRLGLLAAGIQPGDEVVVPANTFVATVEAVAQAGGTPVLVDASEIDFNIDVDAALARNAPFVMPVHLYGQMTNVSALARGASTIVEDACQAHGASRDGKAAGTVGTVGAFSFYPGKNLGAMGDAGAITTHDPEVAERSRALREHGQTAKYHHSVEGWTARLDTIQALVLLHKLPHLEKWNAERRRIASFYDSALEDVRDLRLPSVPEGSRPVWHLYVVRTTRADDFVRYLGEHGIQTGRHYPEPIHLTAAYGHLGYARGDFPVAEKLAHEVVSLPMFPGMSEAQLDAVVRCIERFFDA